MDLDLSPEHELLRDTIRDFMTSEVAPVVEEHERERRFPIEIVRRLGELGWLGIPIPEDEGGAGLDTLAYAIAIEEIGRVWGSLGLIVAAHTSLGCGPLHLAGTDEQKQRYLVPMASGKVIGAYGLTEPGAGSDAGGTRTTARLEGDCWVSTAASASSPTPATPARTSSPRGPARPTRATPRSAPSSSRPTRPASASGGSRTSWASTRRPPASCSSTTAASRPRTCSAQQGDGFRTFLKILDGGRIRIGALAVGPGPGRLDARIPYAQTREQFGRPIGSFQGVAFMIADMATEIEAARRSSGRPPGSRTRAATTPSSPRRPSCSPPRSARARRTPRSRSTAATAT